MGRAFEHGTYISRLWLRRQLGIDQFNRLSAFVVKNIAVQTFLLNQFGHIKKRFKEKIRCLIAFFSHNHSAGLCVCQNTGLNHQVTIAFGCAISADKKKLAHIINSDRLLNRITIRNGFGLSNYSLHHPCGKPI